MNVVGTGEEIKNPSGEVLLLLSASLKTLSFADRGLSRRTNRVPTIFLTIGVISAVSVFFLDESLRLLFGSISGIFLALSASIYLLHNKNWTGLPSLKYCIAGSIACFIIFILLLSTSYPFGAQTRFIPIDDTIRYAILIVGVLSYSFHMAFIGLIVGRNARENTFKLRKSVRMQQAVEQSTAKEKASAALADERYHLLKMLTHEVRQPLNTAQAALEKMGEDLRRRQSEPECIQQTLIKTQSTVNSIVLSISNSILGATLITKGRPPQLHSIDLCDVSQLALSDLDPSQRSRIEKKFEQPVIFADGDPIILRLAIRNLLENAVKYSPSGSPILFEIVTDEEKLTLVIRVTNELHDQSTLSADIFQMNKRGVDSRYEGTGLGLYIVKAVAELHEGDISYHFVSGNQVAFELSIPA
jgi:signal transduction histidine kinase